MFLTTAPLNRGWECWLGSSPYQVPFSSCLREAPLHRLILANRSTNAQGQTMYWKKKSSRGPQTHVFCWTPTPEPHHHPPPVQARGWGLVGPLLFPTLTRPGLESTWTAGPQPAHAPAGLLEFSLHAAGWLCLGEPTARHLGAGIRCSRLYTELIHLVT